MQRIDHGITGQEYLGVVHALAAQVVDIVAGGGKMKRRDLRNQPAVHLLGKGAVDVPGAQTRLDMADRNPPVKPGKRPGESGRCIALDQNNIWIFFIEYGV